MKKKNQVTSNLVRKSDYNTKITNIENNVRQLQAYDLSYFKGKQYFDEESGKQNYMLLIMFYHGNLKDYLMKVLNRLQHRIIILIQD